jgi:hypothetical protein
MQLARYWSKVESTVQNAVGEIDPVCLLAAGDPRSQMGTGLAGGSYRNAHALGVSRAQKLFWVQEIRTWEAQYTAACQPWATCALLEVCGNPLVHAAVLSLLQIHDDRTRANTNLPLA